MQVLEPDEERLKEMGETQKVVHDEFQREKIKTEELDIAEGSYQGMNNFITFVRLLKKNDYDCFAGVSSIKGFGKSTFTIIAARNYYNKFLRPQEGKRFGIKELETYIGYDEDDVYKKATLALPPYSPLVCDESVNFAMAEDWSKTASKSMKKMFAKIRTKHLSIYFNIPEFFWLDSKYRNTMVSIWLLIIKKGYVIAFLPDLRPQQDHWHTKEFMEIPKYTFVDLLSPTKFQKVLNAYRKHPCFFDGFAFPKLDDRLYNAYEEIRNRLAIEREAKIRFAVVKEKELVKRYREREQKLLYFMNKEKAIPTEEIGKIIGIKASRVSQIMHRKDTPAIS